MTAALRKMIDTEQTAAKTGISPARQKKLRDTGQFCRWYRHGRRIYYDEDELAEFLAAQPVKPYPRKKAETTVGGDND